MIITLALACVAVLLALAPLAVLLGRAPAATPIIYGASLAAALTAFFAATAHLVAQAPPIGIALPVGLPWIGAHFRMDALSAFFLAVVDLGAAAASLFALGYGQHEKEPLRVLPFYPAFLAGMNLVVLADDAFSFLLSWNSCRSRPGLW
jgi:hydrogenase-4 component B